MNFGSPGTSAYASSYSGAGSGGLHSRSMGMSFDPESPGGRDFDDSDPAGKKNKPSGLSSKVAIGLALVAIFALLMFWLSSSSIEPSVEIPVESPVEMKTTQKQTASEGQPVGTQLPPVDASFQASEVYKWMKSLRIDEFASAVATKVPSGQMKKLVELTTTSMETILDSLTDAGMPVNSVSKVRISLQTKIHEMDCASRIQTDCCSSTNTCQWVASTKFAINGKNKFIPQCVSKKQATSQQLKSACRADVRPPGVPPRPNPKVSRTPPKDQSTQAQDQERVQRKAPGDTNKNADTKVPTATAAAAASNAKDKAAISKEGPSTTSEKPVRNRLPNANAGKTRNILPRKKPAEQMGPAKKRLAELAKQQKQAESGKTMKSKLSDLADRRSQ